MKTVSRIFRLLAIILGLLYLAALAIWAIGTFGLFGQQRDALSALFLIPLGLPWNRLGDGLTAGLFAPLVNIAILILLSRWMRRRARTR